MQITNKFITFEGIDGSGKTTQSKMLVNFLTKNMKYKAIWTREVGGSEVGEDIREIVINNRLNEVSELFLIMAARKEHIAHTITSSLNKGVFVVCDRYIDSTVAYQTSSSLSMNHIFDLHREYLDNIMPSLTFYIKVSYQTAITRIKARGQKDRFDDFTKNTFNTLSRNYDILSKRYQDRIITIDGNRDIEIIHQDIQRIILDRIKQD